MLSSTSKTSKLENIYCKQVQTETLETQSKIWTDNILFSFFFFFFIENESTFHVNHLLGKWNVNLFSMKMKEKNI